MIFYVCKIRWPPHMSYVAAAGSPFSRTCEMSFEEHDQKQIHSTPPTRTRTSEGCRRKRLPDYADAFTGFQAQPPYYSCAELRSINNTAVTQPGIL